MAAFSFLAALLAASFLVWSSHSLTLSSRLVHRFSDEAGVAAASRGGGQWPDRRSAEYYQVLARSDIQRQKRLLGSRYQTLFPSEGSETFNLGNDFGWLHYTWIDIGTPNVSFLVALDAGSDLLWVPCDCIQCAPLSGYHSSLDKDLGMQDKDLGMYSPAESRTSRHVSCSHELCALGSSCNSPKQPCPYNINYSSENTSSSGLLIEDTLYMASNEDRRPIQTSVIIGCGKRQSGGYLDGIAPDGLLGLGFGEISVPSFLARSGLVRNSFSLCFQEEDSGRIYFGDQGVATQQSTPFIPSNGKYITYIVEAESFCIGSRCLGKNIFHSLVDSGTSFTFLPDNIYKKVTTEFDRQVNAPRLAYNVSPWEYCYKASPLEMPVVPTVTLIFAVNKSFVANSPVYHIYGEEGNLAGFCLALQSTADSMGIIGQNLMTGYRMVFDRENLKLGWSQSNCQDLDNSRPVHLTPPPQNRPENPLPTDQQQSTPRGRAVAPAVAGRTPPTNPSAASPLVVAQYCLLLLVTQVAVMFIG
ncbi:aspartic proteinase-like protein 1 [Phoenix dactylifera]|uniref:Aspartic proteinase-like protein 1 n=1 Tax=Phoenix dactylifera TaxID=42345 RepID=A0A8B8ZG75_PHODC|nr:aspartic proteinase-like protein 1 [Phoenix dactylifera]